MSSEQDGFELLSHERKMSKLNSNSLAVILYGGEKNLKRKRELEKLIFKDPIFSKRENYFLSRTEYYERGLQKANHLANILKSNPQFTQEDGRILWDAVDEVSKKVFFKVF